MDVCIRQSLQAGGNQRQESFRCSVATKPFNESIYKEGCGLIEYTRKYFTFLYRSEVESQKVICKNISVPTVLAGRSLSSMGFKGISTT